MIKKRVFSGLRPTGRIHLGHLVGALNNWVKLQDKYDCFYSIVDWHALTTEYADTREIKRYIFESAVDWFSVGLDPDKSTIFVQSHVVEHAELHLLLSMVVPVPWLERVPSYKEQQKELPDKDLSTYGFLGYPLLQTADIILYKAHYVPVGEDQVPHVELAREIVRRFNNFYGNIFPEPKALLTKIPRLLGLDGRKMSKSYGNFINVSDEPEVIREKVDSMFTDPQRARRKDPGNPDVCNVFSYHKIFSPSSKVLEIENECKKAGIGCTDCKKNFAKTIIQELTPYREKGKELMAKPQQIWDILNEGRDKAKKIASQNMKEVREAMKIDN
jgi:tryptophanyl-tRNA synthetase